jgi:type II secretory pathway component PulF
MIARSVATTPLFGLFGRLTRETKTFIRQEISLAKAELSEKIAMVGRNAVSIVIGGFVAYAGFIVLLIGLGVVIGFALTRAGMEPLLAGFIGLAIIGIIVAGVGYIFIAKALKNFKEEGVAPTRTIQTLKELKGDSDLQAELEKLQHEHDENHHYKYEPTSEELMPRVEATESRMGETLDELGRRLSPHHINEEIKSKLAQRPYAAGLVAMGVGVIGGLVVTKKLRRR